MPSLLLPIELHIVRTARRTLRRPTTDCGRFLVDQPGKGILVGHPFGHAGHRCPLDVFPITFRFGEHIGLDGGAIKVGGFDLGEDDIPSNVSDVLVLYVVCESVCVCGQGWLLMVVVEARRREGLVPEKERYTHIHT